jgi:fatty acid-binding protein DegV
MHSKCPENAQQLAATIQAECNAKQVDYASIGPVIGTHVGPGSLAVVMYPTSALQL